jgi:predicted ABC-type ATPase
MRRREYLWARLVIVIPAGLGMDALLAACAPHAEIVTHEWRLSMENRKMMIIVTGELAKSYVSAHIRTLPSGKVIQIKAHNDRRSKKVEPGEDSRTPDMFRSPSKPMPKRDIPDECWRNPEKCTPDLFSGDTELEETQKVGAGGTAVPKEGLEVVPLKDVLANREAELDAVEADYAEQLKGFIGDLSALDSKVTPVRGKKENKDALNERAGKARRDYEQRMRDISIKYDKIIKLHPEEIARRAESKRINEAAAASLPAKMGAGTTDRMTKSKPRTLFVKSHIKQFTRKDGTIVKEHYDKRTKKAEALVPGRNPGAPDEGKDPEDIRGSAHGYGTHNIEEGDALKFNAGDFKGGGRVKSVGKDGAVVTDESGRDHNVHWHEVTGFKADRGDGGKKSPSDGGKPVKEGDDEPNKGQGKASTVLGKQEPIPAESFKASDYAKSHDQSDVSVDSILASFPEDTKGKIAKAADRLANIEETFKMFHADGEWTTERQELHRKIMFDGVVGKDENGDEVKIPGILSPERQKAARPQDGDLPTFVLLGGRGGSGKSSLKGLVYDPEQCIVLDADHIKSMLPEYEGWNAAQVHEESGELFDMAAEYSRIMGLNVVLDKTMKTAKSAVSDVHKFKKAGYRTEAHYMHLPRQEAAKRAVKRFLDGGESGRYVPVEIVLSNTGNEDSFDQVKGMCDAWSFHDNNVPRGSKPILISQHGDPIMKRKDVLKKSLGKRIIFVRSVAK